jgi:hypothetical protein
MRLCLGLIALITAPALFAQTGPGGVGSSATNVLWLKADAGTSTTVNFGAVSQWDDMSGNANHATQATSSQQPLFTTSLINTMPALFFDNAGSPNNDLLSIADANNLDNTSGLTILTVTRPISIDGSNARGIVSKRVGAGDNQSYTLFYYTSNKINIDVEGNDNRFQSAATFSAGRDYIYGLIYDGTLTSTSRSKTFINGAVDFIATETATAISNFASPVIIGSMNIGDGRPYGGYIAEVIIYRKALNFAERVISHSYLFAKYGFSSTSVPATVNDFYTGDDPVRGDYDFELGGVGVDLGGSNTSVSATVAGGLSMSVVSGFENGDYILYAHQAGSNDAQISDTGGMTGANNARWTRVWYFDITNTSTTQNVNISFDLSDAGQNVTPVTASNYVLLQRAGLSGNWTEVATASGIAGDVISFNGVSVAADGYYTLGSRNYITSPLPVTLLDFTGAYTEKGVELTWTTATEHNNDYFTIEHSANGVDFMPIATVKASGDSRTETTYRTFDPEPFTDRSYYRLNQTDYDGKITHLKIIAVNTYERNGVIEVIPNPSNGSFWFELPEGVSSSELKVLNSAGQEVPFNFTSMGSRVQVDALDLPRGLYLLKLITNRGMNSAKIVIE